MTLLSPKRGGIPSPKSALEAAEAYVATTGAPPNFITVPAQISFWGNDNYDDCAAAEEAFAKACNNPEIFISETEVISWALAHDVLQGSPCSQVLEIMQGDGFQQSGFDYVDGAASTVDYTDAVTLQSAISNGPVKIGCGSDELESAWGSTGGHSGWFAVGFKANTAHFHVASLCGYGTIDWLAQQLNVAVPGNVDGSKPGYAIFTWNSIGIIDVPSLLAITTEAWLRQPTTTTIKALLHTIRDDNGNWQGQMQAIPVQPISLSTAAAGSIDGQSLQVVAVDSDGELNHIIYDNLGNWQMGGMQGIPNTPGRFTGIGSAGTAAGLHVVSIGFGDGQLYHTVRDNNGGWQGQMDAIPGPLPTILGRVRFGAVAAGSADGQSLQVVAVGSDGQIYHTIDDNNGWQPLMYAIPGQPSGITFTAVAAAGTAAGLNVVGVGNDGQLYHTIRDNNGNWQSKMGVIPGQPISFSAATAGSADGQSLQVVGVGSNGQLYHTIRDNNGNWQTGNMQPIAGAPSGITFTAVAAAGAAAALHVVGVGSNAELYYTFRDYNGNWQTGGMHAIPVQPINLSAAAAGSADGQSFQVVGVGSDGKIYHTIDDNNGWQPLLYAILGQPSGITFTAVAAAGTAAGLNVIGVGNDGQLYHTIRDNNGNWQAQMGVIPGQPISFSAAAAGSVDGQSLQVVGVGTNGQLYHTIRDNSGNWQTGNMQPITGAPSGVTFTAVGSAGTAAGLNVIGVGNDGQLYHTVRDKNRKWQAQMDVVPGQPVRFKATAAGSTDGQSLQVVAVGIDGRIYLTMRDNNRPWQAQMQAIPGQPGGFTFAAVAAAGTAVGLRVVGVSFGNGQLYHTIHDNNSNWHAQDMQAVPGQPVNLRAVAAGSADAESLQVIGVGSDGKIYHTIRDNNDNWQTGGMQAIPGQPGGITFTSVGTAGTAAGLQVVGVGSDGQLYHTIRDNNGNWQTGDMQIIPGQVLDFVRINFNAAAAGSADGQSLQVVGVGFLGAIYHTVRDNNGQWQAQMQAIPGQPGGITFTAVGSAGTAAGLQVVGVGSNAQLYHTIRDNNDNWQAQMQAIPGQPINFTVAAAGSSDGQSLQVVGVGSDRQLYHTIRDTNGNWEPIQVIPGQPSGVALSVVGSAGTTAGLQVVGA